MADRKSFAFRPGRSPQDAQAYILNALKGAHAPEIIVRGDIKAYYASLHHSWLLGNAPMDKKVLKEFLDAGYVYAGLISGCEAYIQKAKQAQLPTVHFDEIHDLQRMWQESSIDGLTFSIGMYGINSMEITIGDEVNQRHNAIITGAVGQGKSKKLLIRGKSQCLW